LGHLVRSCLNIAGSTAERRVLPRWTASEVSGTFRDRYEGPPRPVERRRDSREKLTECGGRT
jgi:hypothetical protein